MSQQHQQPQGGYGQQTAGTSQFGAETPGAQMGQQGTPATGQQTGSQMGRGTGQMQHGPGQIQQGMGQQMGMRLSDVETPQQRATVEDVARAIQVCEWCADQCIQEANPHMIECIRLCRDVSELGETVLTLVPRNSRYAQEILGTFHQVVQACGQECSRHSEGHCQECAAELGRTSESIQQFLGTFGGPGGATGQQQPVQ